MPSLRGQQVTAPAAATPQAGSPHFFEHFPWALAVRRPGRHPQAPTGPGLPAAGGGGRKGGGGRRKRRHSRSARGSPGSSSRAIPAAAAAGRAGRGRGLCGGGDGRSIGRRRGRGRRRLREARSGAAEGRGLGRVRRRKRKGGSRPLSEHAARIRLWKGRGKRRGGASERAGTAAEETKKRSPPGLGASPRCSAQPRPAPTGRAGPR